MCTLVLAHRVLPGYPVVVLANRDEMLDRPASGPDLIRSAPAAFGGRDHLQGGTWFGLNEHGMVVGLTNLAGGPMDASLRSRGALVMDLLGLARARQAADAIASIGPGQYNGFNVIVTDGEEAWRAQYDERPVLERLADGVHAATNWRAGAEGEGKAAYARQQVERAFVVSASPAQLVAQLQTVASEHTHDADPRHSLCCHYGGYGTRSSTILLAGGRELRYLHSEGAPCTAAYEDYTSRAVKALALQAR